MLNMTRAAVDRWNSHNKHSCNPRANRSRLRHAKQDYGNGVYSSSYLLRSKVAASGSREIADRYPRQDPEALTAHSPAARIPMLLIRPQSLPELIGAGVMKGEATPVLAWHLQLSCCSQLGDCPRNKDLEVCSASMRPRCLWGKAARKSRPLPKRRPLGTQASDLVRERPLARAVT